MTGCEFHWREGWKFRRIEGGAVTITNGESLNKWASADAMIEALQDMADHADNPEGFNQNEGDAWRDGIEAAIRTIRLGGWRDRP